ncbi:MAG: FAD-dependent monooxygenase, partial [Thermoplasmata archaeon]|nr:FAD-dependent monooxygenase [Thermoplasmata archaeon]
MVHDLIVVGAGPVGSLLASIVAEAGYDVLLCEEHKIVGEPTQCAGLVTERALELAGIGRESILQEISGATLLGPKMEKIHLSSPRKKIYSIDRVLFDQTLAVRAERGGAELRLDTRIKSIEVRKKRCAAHLADGNIEEARYVAGCDGPASITRRAMGIGPPMSMLSGVEVEARTEGCSKEILLRCGRGIAPGFFTWAIPAGDGMVRIGLAVEPSMSKQPAKR